MIRFLLVKDFELSCVYIHKKYMNLKFSKTFNKVIVSSLWTNIFSQKNCLFTKTTFQSYLEQKRYVA